MFKQLPIIALCLSGLILPDPGYGSSLAREGSGANPFAIWAPLSSYELAALGRADKAQTADPDALLDLALLAAGIREQRQAQPLRDRIVLFLKNNGPGLQREKDLRRRGELLHQAMHREFMLPEGDTRRPRGYQLEQSSLATLLTSGTYNCTSSALLYLILAHYCQLDVRAAVLPDHVFVELRRPGQAVVEIETTNSQGYDWPHDQDFYRRQADDWASWRGLTPATYDDYRRRRFHSTLELIAHNMDDLHTRKLPAFDHLRLLEIKGLLLPTDPDSLLQRLAVYNNEYNRLSQEERFGHALQMFTAISPFLSQLKTGPATTPEITTILAWLAFEEASAQLKAGAPARAQDGLDDALRLQAQAPTDDPVLRANCLSLLSALVQELCGRVQFTEGETLLAGYIGEFGEQQSYRQTRRLLYNRWGAYHWGREEWDQALGRLRLELELVARDEPRELARVQDSITSCYLNRGSSALRDKTWQEARRLNEEGLTWAEIRTPSRVGEFRLNIAQAYQIAATREFQTNQWPAAADYYQQQLTWTEEHEKRTVIMANLGAVYNNWKNLYLGRQDPTGAAGVLDECRQRFPEVSLCAEQLRKLQRDKTGSHPGKK